MKIKKKKKIFLALSWNLISCMLEKKHHDAHDVDSKLISTNNRNKTRPQKKVKNNNNFTLL